MLRIAALIGMLGTATADAPQRLVVAVDETVELEVGYAVGFRCDDTRILEPSMKTKSETTNVFVVKGIAVGTTLCRVGTAPERPTMLLEVRVVAAKPRR
jgi:hypothetical protein